MSEEIFTRWVDPTIEKYKQEIERLKESEEYHRKGYVELHKRIDETIEYIEMQQKIFKDYDVVVDTQLKNILNILKGEDKE